MNGWIDAHHHLWDLNAVNYPWLMAKGVKRFFGDPTPIQRNYLIAEFRSDAAANGFVGSVHIQVGAEASWEEAKWVQRVADANPDWPMAQVVFCDLTAPDLIKRLDNFQMLSTVRGVRQIVGRAPSEDATTGTNNLLSDPRFLDGLKEVGRRGLSFDLQLIPELMDATSEVLAQVPMTAIALCHAGSPHDRSAIGMTAWAGELTKLSKLPNVTCKLSGLGMFHHEWTVESVRPIIETCLEQFGPERCMFGSNFPVDSLSSDFSSTYRAHHLVVPKNMHSAVFKSTASSFYSIGLPSEAAGQK